MVLFRCELPALLLRAKRYRFKKGGSFEIAFSDFFTPSAVGWPKAMRTAATPLRPHKPLCEPNSRRSSGVDRCLPNRSMLRFDLRIHIGQSFVQRNVVEHGHAETPNKVDEPSEQHQRARLTTQNPTAVSRDEEGDRREADEQKQEDPAEHLTVDGLHGFDATDTAGEGERPHHKVGKGQKDAADEGIGENGRIGSGKKSWWTCHLLLFFRGGRWPAPPTSWCVWVRRRLAKRLRSWRCGRIRRSRGACGPGPVRPRPLYGRCARPAFRGRSR